MSEEASVCAGCHRVIVRYGLTWIHHGAWFRCPGPYTGLGFAEPMDPLAPADESEQYHQGHEEGWMAGQKALADDIRRILPT